MTDEHLSALIEAMIVTEEKHSVCRSIQYDHPKMNNFDPDLTCGALIKFLTSQFKKDRKKSPIKFFTFDFNTEGAKIEKANDILKFIFENAKKWDKLTQFYFYGGDITKSISKEVVEEWFAMQKNLVKIEFKNCGMTLPYLKAILNGFIQSIKRRGENNLKYKIIIELDETANTSVFYNDKFREFVTNFLR